MAKPSAYGVQKAIERAAQSARINRAMNSLPDELKLKLVGSKSAFFIEPGTEEIRFTSDDQSLADDILAFLSRYHG